mgnify:FL=1
MRLKNEKSNQITVYKFDIEIAGTEKQVAWATKIQNEKLTGLFRELVDLKKVYDKTAAGIKLPARYAKMVQLTKMISFEDLTEKVLEIAVSQDAKEIIENRNSQFSLGRLIGKALSK